MIDAVEGFKRIASSLLHLLLTNILFSSSLSFSNNIILIFPLKPPPYPLSVIVVLVQLIFSSLFKGQTWNLCIVNHCLPSCCSSNRILIWDARPAKENINSLVETIREEKINVRIYAWRCWGDTPREECVPAGSQH